MACESLAGQPGMKARVVDDRNKRIRDNLGRSNSYSGSIQQSRDAGVERDRSVTLGRYAGRYSLQAGDSTVVSVQRQRRGRLQWRWSPERLQANSS
jgi:hypothetical protein